jgi:hypothetical protein
MPNRPPAGWSALNKLAWTPFETRIDSVGKISATGRKQSESR